MQFSSSLMQVHLAMQTDSICPFVRLTAINGISQCSPHHFTTYVNGKSHGRYLANGIGLLSISPMRLVIDTLIIASIVAICLYKSSSCSDFGSDDIVASISTSGVDFRFVALQHESRYSCYYIRDTNHLDAINSVFK